MIDDTEAQKAARARYIAAYRAFNSWAWDFLGQSYDPTRERVTQLVGDLAQASFDLGFADGKRGADILREQNR